MNTNFKCLITTSTDCYIRIFDLFGEMLGSVNVYHPLPIKWDLDYNFYQKVKKKVFFALKLLDITLSKYKHEILRKKIFSIGNFLNNLIKKIYVPT